MKKYLLATAALIAMGMCAPASAADMPVKYKEHHKDYDWSGFYLGVSTGWAWNQVDRVFPGAPGSNFSSEGDNAVIDLHLGVQSQWANWVIGAEMGITAGFDELRSTSALLPAPPFAADRVGEHKISHLYTAGLRLGYAWDKWMVYGTGGVAAAAVKSQYCVASTGLCGPVASLQNGQSLNYGWYAGGGLEYVVHKGTVVDVVAGLEYIHFEVDEKSSFCLVAGCAAPAPGFDYNTSASGDIFRYRLTLKTQGWDIFGVAPVRAKY